MAFSKFRMPQNFNGFPKCPCCLCKDFTKVKVETGYLFKCDKCKNAFFSWELGINDSIAPIDPVIHPHIKAWNSSKTRNEVAETVHNMEKDGSKALRVRKPWEL